MDDDIFHLHQDDVKRMLLCKTHVGSQNCNFQMEQYVFKRNDAGVHVINLRKTWEKLLLAARAIAAIQPATDVFVVSSRNVGQRAVLKFARYIGATPVAGRFTPGAFTNQSQKAFQEPRILVICDPLADHQPITESSYVNLPVIAFCDTDSPLRFVDIAIPCNNKAKESVGLMWWLLAREVKRLRGEISRATGWDVMPDMFILREAEEIEKQENIDQSGMLGHEMALGGGGGAAGGGYGGGGAGGAGGEPQPLDIGNVEDWSAEPLTTNQAYGDMSSFQPAANDSWDVQGAGDNWGAQQSSQW